jgi:DNA-binding winged helix-turn-helix (wHTH) protein/tetratricopeptide (TPR) repeat protein
MQVPTPNSIIRFGVFQLDARTGELHRGGKRIRLQDQPVRVLLMLLEQPGELVTREALKRQIWPNEDFGDFDHAVNVAVVKIRAALSDNAGSPRFVETLPRRGYRFIFPVHLPTDAPSSVRDEGPGLPSPEIEVKSTPPVNAASEPAPETRRRATPVVWLASSLAIVVVAAALVWGFAFRRTAKIGEKSTVVLAEFANGTGDPVFDRTMKRGLEIALAQSPYVKILSDDEIQKTLGYMRRDGSTPLTSEIAREVCKRTSSAAALDGVVDRVGSGFVVAVKAINCDTGQLLGETEFRAADKDGVLDALGKASSDIRHQLGESIASVKKSDKPLIEASTSSIDALQAFTLWNYEEDDDASMNLLKRAVSFDPHFALAYLQMANIYTAHGEAKEAIENLKKAYEFRNQASDWERLTIESQYEENVTGDIEKAHDVYELRARLSPEDTSAVEGTSGIYTMRGQFDLALTALKKSFKIDPDKAGNYRTAALLAIFANRLDEARSLNSLANEKESKDPTVGYLLAFLDGDTTTMQRAVKTSEGAVGEEGIVSMHSDSEAHIGHLKRANELSTHTVALCKKKGHPEEAAEYQTNIALRDAEFGRSKDSIEAAEQALHLAPTRDVRILAAIALARAGHADEAERLADEVDKAHPQNTQIQHYWLPTARAAIYLDRKDPQKAIDVLGKTADLELGFIYPTIEVNGFLYPAFLRGEALLLLHREDEAVREFRKFSDRRTIVLNNPLGALAKLEIGRAYALHGDTTQARTAYQEFLHLWQDADANIPVFQEAKAEYTRLN